uniref:Putative NACHT domain protein n=1 Tax=Vesanto virus TaxID=1955786 RepID=A0A7D4VXW9_9VIRU|nr:putative NACHT domain protein [Vesanto virus]QKT21511.1 putative NACHT domain protein [Vesanto virus]
MKSAVFRVVSLIYSRSSKMGKHKIISCPICEKQMRSDKLNSHRCTNYSKLSKAQCICGKEMRADNLGRHRRNCSTVISDCKSITSKSFLVEESSSQSLTSSKPSTSKQVFQQVKQYKHLDFEDKLVAPKKVKKMSSTLRNITSAKEERRLVYERTKCMESPTTGQKLIMWLIQKHINSDLNKQSPIIILEDKPGQSGKSTLAKSLMYCSEKGKEIQGLRLPQQYNFFFVYLRNLNVEQCSSFISYEEMLQFDAKRRFILWLDITREFRLPPGKLESIHDGLLDVGSLAKESLHLLQPFFIIVTCNESKHLIKTLSKGRYILENIHDKTLEAYMLQDTCSVEKQNTCSIEKQVLHDKIPTNNSSNQKFVIDQLAPAKYIVRRKIYSEMEKIEKILDDYTEKSTKELDDINHQIHVLQDQLINSDITELQREKTEYRINYLKSILKLNFNIKQFKNIDSST